MFTVTRPPLQIVTSKAAGPDWRGGGGRGGGGLPGQSVQCAGQPWDWLVLVYVLTIHTRHGQISHPAEHLKKFSLKLVSEYLIIMIVGI